MPNSRTTWTAFITVFCILGVVLVVLLSGCEYAEHLDDAIWNRPSATPGPTSGPAAGYPAPGPQTAPPIIEIIGGLLAAGGFGGMARWLHNIRKQSNGRMDAVILRVQNLEFKNAANDNERTEANRN